MWRASNAIWRGKCRSALRAALVVACASLTAFSTLAIAQGGSNADSWTMRIEAQSDAAVAGELYLDALEKLDSGRRDAGFELLQSLIDRFPDTPVAALAKRILADADRPALRPPMGLMGPGQPLAARPVAIGISDLQRRFLTEAGDRIFFGPGSAELGARARLALEGQAAWLKKEASVEIVIEGHADDSGSDADNLALSARRAEAIRQQLVDQGIEPARLAAKGSGRANRIALCDSTDCKAQNRRVVTLVFPAAGRERLGWVGRPSAPAVPVMTPGSKLAH